MIKYMGIALSIVVLALYMPILFRFCRNWWHTLNMYADYYWHHKQQKDED